MIIELHLLQNFAPSNLNRDDTGTPKNSEFGGYRRARISSQCQKRAIRRMFPNYLYELGLAPDDLAERTRLVVNECVNRLVATGKPEELARTVVAVLLGGVNLKVEDDQTQYLLFLGRREIARLSELAVQHWDELAGIAKQMDTAPSGTGKRNAKKGAAALVPKPIKDAVLACLDSGKAIDLALFGRMVADLPDVNCDAACQVAHAVSTNTVNIEFDYYTAVEDLPSDNKPGAGMIGTVEFNSACYYRYASVDLGQLMTNLQDDAQQCRKALHAFIKAMIEAVPTGKQNTFAAHNPPSLIAVVIRHSGQWNLVNAFAKPIVPRGNQSLIELSITALDDYWGRLTTMYGTKRLKGVWAVSSEAIQMPHLAQHTAIASKGTGEDVGEQGQRPLAFGEQLRAVDDLIERVMDAVENAEPTGAA
ncbi:MAG: type I-E CRISPR-associated protein Cas7/Cse4/CasC [Herpetosiphonaceae bacterium]|nr:type I-E CRISPR-associated protein Cas7/Cse4/CasC [Herpetosiphonaceae bacterium]